MNPPLDDEWRGHAGPPDARRLEVYCDGGTYEGDAGIDTPRHSAIVVARLVELRPQLHFDGGMQDWLFEDVEHTTVQVLKSPRSLLPAERPKIVCPCGEDLTIGDSLGVGYTTADQDEAWDWWNTEDPHPPWANEPTWAKRSRNSKKLSQFADASPTPRLSLNQLRRILSMS